MGYRTLSETDKRSIEYDIKQMYENEMINRANPSSSSSISINLQTSGTSKATTTTRTTTTSTSTNSTSSSTLNTTKKLTAMEEFLEAIGQDIVSQGDTSTRATIVDEIYSYRSLISKYINKNKGKTLSCLTFWKAHEFTLPYMFSLAKRYVCTPATSVPAEAAFSVSSYVARKERSRLSAQNLQQTMFLKVCINRIYKIDIH